MDRRKAACNSTETGVDLHGELFDLSRFTFDIPAGITLDRRSTSFSAKELEMEERAQNHELGSRNLLDSNLTRAKVS